MDRKLILVSNDDSYAASGVRVLVKQLLKYGDVVAVCPENPQSGQSMALTVNSPIRITQIEDWDGAKIYKVSGTPVDCIKLAMHHILDRRPDLVCAGINHGSNAAVNVLYSGTMGAAMEGCTFGIPSIGFSLTDHSPTADFSPCLPIIDTLVPLVLEHGLPENVCLNVNVPNIPGVPREMRLAVPCRGRWNDEYKEFCDPHGHKFYWLTGEYVNEEPDNELTDEWALAHGFVSVVPVSIGRTADIATTPLWLSEAGAVYKNNI